MHDNVCVRQFLCTAITTCADAEHEQFSAAYLKILWGIKNNILPKYQYTTQDNYAKYLQLAFLLNRTTVWSKRFLFACDHAFCTSLNKEDSIPFL